MCADVGGFEPERLTLDVGHIHRADFTRRFVSETQDLLGRIDPADIEGVVDELVATKARGGRLFFCGSGGGAGHASHAACDFRKLGGFEAYCVTDNVSELTARINDDGWDGAYVAWPRGIVVAGGRPHSFVFSVGGGDEQRRISVNLVNAMRLTKEVGGSIVGIAGRDGGMLRRVATARRSLFPSASRRISPRKPRVCKQCSGICW